MTTETMKRVISMAAATAAVLVACGGDLAIGSSQNPLTGDACSASECGSTPFTCASGPPTDVECTRHGGTCGWSGTCPGDCAPIKCANQGGGCARATEDAGASSVAEYPTNLRCVPSPYRGMGSASADQCDLTFDCAPAPSPVCPMSACANQGFGCSTGDVVNLRCVPDPNAGVGSDPVGACVLAGECPPDADASVGTTIDASAGNVIDASAGTTVDASAR